MSDSKATLEYRIRMKNLRITKLEKALDDILMHIQVVQGDLLPTQEREEFPYALAGANSIEEISQDALADKKVQDG